MRTAYICSPYRAKTDAELDNHIDYAQQLTSLALAAGVAPVTPHLYLTQVTDDRKDEERERGLRAGQALLEKCDVVIVGNKYGVSEGMKAEIALAEKTNTPVIAITDDTTPEELSDLVGRTLYIWITK